jgi:ACR3 family arsenite transporter
VKKSRLSFLDRYLRGWIFAATVICVALGWLVPGVVPFLNRFSIGTRSVPELRPSGITTIEFSTYP